MTLLSGNMPDRFDAIIGQDSAIERLRGALANDRLPHALLFAGPEGVGKFRAARALAASFLTGNRIAERVENGTHPDFHLITRQLVRVHDKTGKSKALALTVDVVREEVIKPAGHKSQEGGGKVFIIEEAETMNAQAQNALLKTLEEPAGKALIVLLTDQPEHLLPTIRSRCQTYRFSLLSEEQAIGVLTVGGITDSEARRAVSIAGGSPGRAMRFLEDGIIDRAEALYDELSRGGGFANLSLWLKEAADGYAGKHLERDPLGSKDAFTRAGFTLYLSLASDFYRRQLREDADGERLETICGNIDSLARTEKYLNANVSVGIALQQLELALR